VLAARARSRAARSASLFDEIYGARAAALPDSVSDALMSLALARRPRNARAMAGSATTV
jgi:hypothetical protein